MANIMHNGVNGIGISDQIPEYVKYFQEVSIIDTLSIPEEKPDMEKLSSIIISPTVVATKLITTPVALSYEGQNLSGYKLIVELSLKEKIRYVAAMPNQSIHAAHYDSIMKSVFVVVPEMYNGKRVCDLIRKNRFSVTPYVEDIYAVMKDCRNIYKCITLLVDVKFF
ncbi:hypothetical protein DVW12_17155 [Clostridium botulinum]|nr:hypothetical protein [Clostridium botulinum]